jgi:hypothetical protein
MKLQSLPYKKILGLLGIVLWIMANCTSEAIAASSSVSQTNGPSNHRKSPLEGKHLHKGTSWVCSPGDSKSRAIAGVTIQEDYISETDVRLLQAGTEYRLDGWIHCSSGSAKLGVDILNEQGRVISRHAGAALKASPTSCYTVVEFATPGKQGREESAIGVRARVWFRLQGQAELNSVNVTPTATSFMGNKAMEADERGRIGFWGEEKDETLMEGRRGGSAKPDQTIKRNGKSSVVLVPSADWFAFSSINYGMAAWTDRYELSIWARCEPSASAAMLACWTDDQQKVVHVDRGPSIRGESWQPMLLTLSAPTNASSVRLVAVARGGRVWLDDSELMRLAPKQKRVRVFVNQVGYEQGGPKSAVIAANFYPSDGLASFRLVTPLGKTAWKKVFPCAGRIYAGTEDDWGWYFWRADFSDCHEAGQLRGHARVGGNDSDSATFAIGPGIVLGQTARSSVDFFFIQRCGFDVPGWHKPCHLDDAKLPDGTHIDAIGGWHSAGDYNKLMYEHGDGGVAFALLNALNNAPESFARHDRNSDGVVDALDEALWGAQFVAKMQIPETGGLRNTISQGPGRQWTKWSAPEVHTDNVAGTADDPVVQVGEGNSPLVIAAWARLSALLSQRGRTNDFLKAAVRLWDYTTKGGTNVGSGYLLLSALELHAVTGQSNYVEYARRSVESLLAQQVSGGPLQGAFGSYGESSAAALASFALAHKDDALNSKIATALKEYVRFCSREADNPFGLSQQPVGEKAQYFPSDLGNNFQILGRAWAAALVYRLNRDPAALRFAVDQMDWVLGKNTYDLCMFEGKGIKNPPRYHHRYNSIPGHERGAVPGMVPNGFVRELGMADRPGFDMSRTGGRSPSFRTSEPWLVHNLFYLLAAGELHWACSMETR